MELYLLRSRECRVFVSVSQSFLGRFQKFKDLIGEHVKTILMNPVTSQQRLQKNL